MPRYKLELRDKGMGHKHQNSGMFTMELGPEESVVSVGSGMAENWTLRL